MKHSSTRLAKSPLLAVLSTLLMLAASRPAQAAGLGEASRFAVLGSTSVYVNTMTFSGVGGDLGGYSLQLTDKVKTKGSAVATASYFGALNLGDKSIIKGRCVTGGGAIDTPVQQPARCLQGQDTSGGDPLLMQTLTAMTDVDALAAGLQALTPTATITEIDNPSGTKGLMTFAPGLNVIAVSSRFLVEASSTLTLDAPAGATVVFLVDGAFTMQSKAKISLTGGLAPDSVVYVATGNVLVGTSARVPGTIIADTGTCQEYEKARITGALFCEGGIFFSLHAKMTYSPLRPAFPN